MKAECCRWMAQNRQSDRSEKKQKASSRAKGY